MLWETEVWQNTVILHNFQQIVKKKTLGRFDPNNARCQYCVPAYCSKILHSALKQSNGVTDDVTNYERGKRWRHENGGFRGGVGTRYRKSIKTRSAQLSQFISALFNDARFPLRSSTCRVIVCGKRGRGSSVKGGRTRGGGQKHREKRES